MILDDKCTERPEIEYPCEWGYKIIGRDRDALEAVIGEVMGERAYTQREGNSSSKGNFHSLNMRCQVESEEDRNAIFKAFQDHTDVKMVM